MRCVLRRIQIPTFRVKGREPTCQDRHSQKTTPCWRWPSSAIRARRPQQRVALRRFGRQCGYPFLFVAAQGRAVLAPPRGYPGPNQGAPLVKACCAAAPASSVAAHSAALRLLRPICIGGRDYRTGEALDRRRAAATGVRLYGTGSLCSKRIGRSAGPRSGRF
jgi:hypothetical protein